jgi:predicted dehydrogenase
MTASVNAAVIGARGVGVSHVAALRTIPGVQVSVIVGSSAASAEPAAVALGVPSWSADWNDAVADESISAVHICTPNNLHFPIAAAALANGKHVICEKPLAIDVSQAARLVGLARERGGQLAVLGYKYRYCPLIQLLREQILEGHVGRVHDIRGSYLQNWMLEPNVSTWRRDPALGGNARVMLDIGTHLMDLMETVLGQRIVSAQGQTFGLDGAIAGAVTPAPLQPAQDDGAHLLMQFEQGTRGIAALSQVSSAHSHTLSLEIDGSVATARWTLGVRETLVISDAKDNSTLRLTGRADHTTAGRYWSSATAPDELLIPLIRVAYAQIGEPTAAGRGVNGGTPSPTFEDGYRHIALIDAL